MPRELRDLGHTVRLRPARPGRRLAPVVAAGVLLAALATQVGDESAAGDEAVVEAVVEDAATFVLPRTLAQEAPARPSRPTPSALPVLGRAGQLLLHVPAREPLLVSYHEASFAEALPIEPLGELRGNDNATRPLAHAAHPEGLPFHVQVSRGRANASTSAVDVVLPPGEAVRAPVAGTVADVRPYQLYGAHDDVRIELRVDDSDLAVVLIHVRDVAVRSGDRVEVGDVLAGGARLFPFGAVVDRQTEPDRYGHVHLEVKAPG